LRRGRDSNAGSESDESSQKHDVPTTYQDSPPDETPPSSSGLTGSSQGVADPMTIPSDADLEAGIIGAVKLGLVDVAMTLSDQLRARQRTRAGNVVPIDALHSRSRA
jgi:hypothetical protein